MLWKASLSEKGRNSLFVEAQTWHAARELCRLLHHDLKFESAWREMRSIEEKRMRVGAKIFYLVSQGEVSMKIFMRPGLYQRSTLRKK